MKSSAKKIELASVDDLFSTEEGRQDAKLEKIQEIPLSELHPFKNHPFKVKDDEAMMETADSIKQYGVLVPAIARPDPEGGYELVAVMTVARLVCGINRLAQIKHLQSLVFAHGFGHKKRAPIHPQCGANRRSMYITIFNFICYNCMVFKTSAFFD